MVDTTYMSKTYRKQGGDEFVVASGGTLKLESGATFTDERFSASVTVDADELVIPVTARYVAKTTGADGEALTLADGTPGQRLNIALVADGGGDGTLTPTTKSGFATIVFADAGDIVDLEYVDDTIGWILVGSAGVAAPPVITV